MAKYVAIEHTLDRVTLLSPDVSIPRWLGFNFHDFFKNTGIKLVNFVTGGDEEKAKIVVHRSIRTALARCWVHVLPLTEIVVLLVLNIRGFYIGTDLEGNHWEYDLTSKMLALRSTAKLLVSENQAPENIEPGLLQ